jgi:holin-like protein
MLLFFIPIVVGVVPQLETVMQKPLPIVIALVSGPVLVMLTAGGVVQRLQKKKQSESMKRRCA